MERKEDKYHIYIWDEEDEEWWVFDKKKEDIKEPSWTCIGLTTLSILLYIGMWGLTIFKFTFPWDLLSGIILLFIIFVLIASWALSED